MSTNKLGRPDSRPSDSGALRKTPKLRALTALAASALLIPETGMAQGAAAGGVPSPPAAVRPPLPSQRPPAAVPLAPVATPNALPLTINGQNAPAKMAPSTSKGAPVEGLTIVGDRVEPVIAPAVTNPPQGPSSGGGRSAGQSGPGVNAIAGQPVSGIGVGFESIPPTIVLNGTTGKDGDVTFSNVPAGRYKISLPQLPKGVGTAGGQKLRVTSRVNGKPQTSVDFPVGGSVGTVPYEIMVAGPQETITLKLEVVR